jgi:hypothetical protein
MSEDCISPVDFITDLVDMGFVQRRATEQLNELAVYYLDLTVLNLALGSSVPFFCSIAAAHEGGSNSTHLQAIVERMASHGGSDSPRVLILGSQLPEVSKHLLKELSSRSVAILDCRSTNEIRRAPDSFAKYKSLTSALVRFLGREALSPYIAGSPADGGRFFGRRHELERLVRNRQGGNFAIVGTRRIGKTSLGIPASEWMKGLAGQILGGELRRSARANCLRQQGIVTPPFPFPPSGASRGGRVPPTPPKAGGSPHKRGFKALR